MIHMIQFLSQFQTLLCNCHSYTHHFHTCLDCNDFQSSLPGHKKVESENTPFGFSPSVQFILIKTW